jgi:hypothetical protein
MAVITCALILPLIGPEPKRAVIAVAADSVASANRLGSRASISFRMGVP